MHSQLTNCSYYCCLLISKYYPSSLQGERGKAIRVCEFDENNGGSQWLDAKYVGCGEEEDYQLSLRELAQVRMFVICHLRVLIYAFQTLRSHNCQK